MIKLNNTPVVFKHFNDNTCRIIFDYPIKHENSITWLYENDEEIIQLYYLANHINSFNVNTELVMPYVNSARQDRVKTSADVFTLKYFCQLINSLNFTKVHIFDPHSPVCEALLNNVVIETPQDLLNLILSELPEDIIIAYPDAGSEKRYRSMLHVPSVVGVKERDWNTGYIRSFYLTGSPDMITGHDVLICDDILSRGTTVYTTSRCLRERGAKNIYVWASHCENTVLEPHINGASLLDIPNLIKKVYTTNSVYTRSHHKIQIVKEF